MLQWGRRQVPTESLQEATRVMAAKGVLQWGRRQVPTERSRHRPAYRGRVLGLNGAVDRCRRRAPDITANLSDELGLQWGRRQVPTESEVEDIVMAWDGTLQW